MHRSCFPGQVDPRLADRKLMRVGQTSRCCEIALAEQAPCDSDVTHPKQKIMLVQERFGLIQDGDCAGHISLRQPHAGEKQCVRGEGVDARRVGAPGATVDPRG